MDEMKINSKFMRNLVAKLVKGAIKKKTGYETDIRLNELVAINTDGTTHIHLNVDAILSKDELIKLLTMIGL